MSEFSIKHDRGIRAAMKSKLFPQGLRTLDELQVSASIADVVTLGEDFHGYEIKAWNDSLRRLSQQVASYDLFFDRCTLVTTMRHEEKAAEILPAHWGLIVATGPIDGDVEKFLTIRDALPNPKQSPNFMLSLIWCDELKQHLKDVGAAKGCRNGHLMRRRMFEIYKAESIRKFVIETLLKRENWKMEATSWQ